MADFEPVFTIKGPPSIRVEQAEVTRDDRVWVQNRIVVQDGRPGVVVVPVDDDGQVALIRILRPVLGREMLELPRGFGETRPAEDARRELLEETGMRALELRPLGTFVVDSGLMPTVVAAYEARVDRVAPRANRMARQAGSCGSPARNSAGWSMRARSRTRSRWPRSCAGLAVAPGLERLPGEVIRSRGE